MPSQIVIAIAITTTGMSSETHRTNSPLEIAYVVPGAGVLASIVVVGAAVVVMPGHSSITCVMLVTFVLFIIFVVLVPFMSTIMSRRRHISSLSIVEFVPFVPL